MNLFFKKIQSAKGVSLLELIVAIALFAVLMLSATAIFKMVINGQRNAISAQNVQENMRYIMEKISKEIRMAQISNQECGTAAINKVFNTANGGSEIYFKNQNGDCVTYYLENKRIKIMVGVNGVNDFVTPAKIEVNNLKFYVVDDLIGVSSSLQPYVVMAMDAKAVGQAINQQAMKIQTTVSSRYYDNGVAAPASCTPDCTGKVCGDDGCSGSCGSCGANETCLSGVCATTSKTYTCSAKPATGTEWNTVSSYNQTWNGSAWSPADDPTTEYNATASAVSCRFTCATNYTWSGSACVASTQTYTCSAKPATGTDWNTVSSYNQTWNGSAWLPADDSTTEYNATADTASCRYTCASGYHWSGSTCVSNTNTYACSAKPATGTDWNTVSSYTQTWTGNAWAPADDATTEYNATASSVSCRYTCSSGYVWNGSVCVKNTMFPLYFNITFPLIF
ncbi:MAG: prepilin-type N-terminal cleavage/methylation domain-containing protein [bacterium]